MINKTYFFLLLITISCTSKFEQSKNIKKDVTETNVPDVHKEEAINVPDLSLFVDSYKLKYDSLVSSIFQKKIISTLKIDTLNKKDLIFSEESILEKTSLGLEYKFLLPNEWSYLKHSIFSLDFLSNDDASSAFKKLRDTALDKNAGPGLTYTNDFVVQNEKLIYWLNSNCRMSFSNHLETVKQFKSTLDIEFTETITCKCGAVICKVEDDN